jgi:hypothetical protein
MRKHPAGSAGQALRGSGDFHAWTDSALYLRANRDHILLRAEHRNAPAPDPLELRLQSQPDGSDTHLAILDTAGLDPPPAETTSPLVLPERILALLQSMSRPLTRLELRRKLRVNNERLGQALAELAQRGLLARSQQGWSPTGQDAPAHHQP